MISTPGVLRRVLCSGELYCNGKPTEIQTILGSCVSVCLFDTKLNIGGMNHYMLPSWKGDGFATPKFGNIAIETLIRQMIALGSDKDNLIAKVMGGAWQLEEMISTNVGERNVDLAFRVLEEHGIDVVASNVGGSQGRKVMFKTDTGELFLKKIGPELFKSSIQYH